MAHQWLRCNLASALFPLTSGIWGRSIIVPQYDENYNRVTVSPVDQGKDKGEPQAFFMENVMPTTAGYQAIRLNNSLAPSAGMPGDLDQLYQCPYYDGASSSVHIIYLATSISDTTHVWVFANGLVWTKLALPGGMTTANGDPSVALVQGVTYIYFKQSGCVVFNGIFPAVTLASQALGGITAANILGICSANGYMIAYTTAAVAWSNQNSPVDFVPSLVTGAGGGSVGDCRGNIVCCLSIAGGFIIYCDFNIVQANYTGNSNFPYKFQEIPGSGGIGPGTQVNFAETGERYISWRDNFGYHFAWTSKGLQQITLGSAAQTIYPEINEFLTGGIVETFNYTTNLIVPNLVSPINSAAADTIINLVGSQYLVISYYKISNQFQYALVFDFSLQRWGKILIPHVEVFQLSGLFNGAPMDTRDQLSFLDELGNVWSVQFEATDTSGITLFGSTDKSVLIIGKYQFQRNKGVYIQRVEFESTYGGNSTNSQLSVLAVPSINGKDLLTPIALTKLINGTAMQQWGGRVYGKNFSVMAKGPFNLSSVLVDLVLGAER